MSWGWFPNLIIISNDYWDLWGWPARCPVDSNPWRCRAPGLRFTPQVAFRCISESRMMGHRGSRTMIKDLHCWCSWCLILLLDPPTSTTRHDPISFYVADPHATVAQKRTAAAFGWHVLKRSSSSCTSWLQVVNVSRVHGSCWSRGWSDEHEVQLKISVPRSLKIICCIS